MTDQDPDGRPDVMVVTGGGHGIGRAAALKLAATRGHVAVWDIDVEAAHTVADEANRTGAQAIAVEVDVADTGSVERAATSTRKALGDPSVLVNNAGVFVPGLLWEITDEEWDRVLSINLTGQFRCARALAPGMIQARRGSIINISSIVALAGRQGGSPSYSASKGGVIGMTYMLAAQLGQYNVRVNAVCPGTVLTGLHETTPPEKLERLLSNVLLHRHPDGPKGATPDDVADAVAFFASVSSAWITGAVLSVSGGQLMH